MLSDLLSGPGLPLEIGQRTLYVRAPTPEEYDDAMSLQAAVRKRMLATPEIAEMRDLPASNDAAALVREAITYTEAELAEAETNAEAARVEVLKARLDGLRGMNDNRSLADEIAEERGILARDRWLTLRLLNDENGKPVVPPNKVTRDSWALLPLRVRNEARPLIWTILSAVNDLPFA
jgi:hypothetical protein